MSKAHSVQKIDAIHTELSRSVEEIRDDLHREVSKNPNLFGTAVIELKLQDGVVTLAQSTIVKHRRPS
jgi:hypothetical protein